MIIGPLEPDKGDRRAICDRNLGFYAFGRVGQASLSERRPTMAVRFQEVAECQG
jgi:hypothetical protein